MEDSPQAETRPTTVLCGMRDGAEKYWEMLAQAQLTIYSVANAVMAQGNTRSFKAVT